MAPVARRGLNHTHFPKHNKPSSSSGLVLVRSWFNCEPSENRFAFPQARESLHRCIRLYVSASPETRASSTITTIAMALSSLALKVTKLPEFTFNPSVTDVFRTLTVCSAFLIWRVQFTESGRVNKFACAHVRKRGKGVEMV